MEALNINHMRLKISRKPQQWEIVMMEFSFVELVQKKLRPALIIFNDVPNKISNSVAVV